MQEVEVLMQPDLASLLRARSQRRPEKLAYTSLRAGEAEDAELRYGDLDRRARAIGAVLQQDRAAGESGGEAIACLEYTSGSTSDPKGVVVTHGNLLQNEELIQHAFNQSEQSVIVGWLPLYHDMGLIGNALQPLYADARCILISPLAFMRQPARWLRAISRYRDTTSGKRTP